MRNWCKNSRENWSLERCTPLKIVKRPTFFTFFNWLSFSNFVFFPFQIIGIKQYLVRPLGLHYAKTPNTSATSSESGSTSSAVVEPLIPDAVLNSSGRSLLDTINDVSSSRKSISAVTMASASHLRHFWQVEKVVWCFRKLKISPETSRSCRLWYLFLTSCESRWTQNCFLGDMK